MKKKTEWKGKKKDLSNFYGEPFPRPVQKIWKYGSVYEHEIVNAVLKYIRKYYLLIELYKISVIC